MTTFITGATGYLGSYVTDVMMRESDERIAVLTRAKDEAEGILFISSDAYLVELTTPPPPPGS